jgi:cytochrome c oxidase subunit 4
MSDHSDDISKHIRGYLIIGGTLIVGTVLTVLASYIDLGHHWNVVLALYFMHLISEKQLIYTVLGFTAFFFIGLMFITIAAYHDYPALTTTN